MIACRHWQMNGTPSTIMVRMMARAVIIDDRRPNSSSAMPVFDYEYVLSRTITRLCETYWQDGCRGHGV